MSKIRWVRVLGLGVLAGLTSLAAGCWNGSGIKGGSNPGQENLTAAEALAQALGGTSEATFEDLVTGFSNEVNSTALLTQPTAVSLLDSLGIALTDAASFLATQNGATGTESLSRGGALPETITITSTGGGPVITVTGEVRNETLNFTITSPSSAAGFVGTIGANSEIQTSGSGAGEALTFIAGAVGIATSNGQGVASNGSNVVTIELGAAAGTLAQQNLPGSAVPVTFTDTIGSNTAAMDLVLVPCTAASCVTRGGTTLTLGRFSLPGLFSKGSDSVTASLTGQLASPASFDPESPIVAGNVPVGQYEFEVSGESIPSVTTPTCVAIGQQLSSIYTDGTPIGAFQVRVAQQCSASSAGTELFQVSIATTVPTSGTGPANFKANVSNGNGTVLTIQNPFSGETAGQLGQVSAFTLAAGTSTVVGTLTAGGGGSLTLTFTDGMSPSLFNVFFIDTTLPSLLN